RHASRRQGVFVITAARSPYRHDSNAAAPPAPRNSRVTAAASVEPSASKRREHIPLGIMLMVGAGILFAGSSATSKWLVATYPVGEILFTRTIISLFTLSLFILPRLGLAVFRTQ